LTGAGNIALPPEPKTEQKFFRPAGFTAAGTVQPGAALCYPAGNIFAKENRPHPDAR